MAAAAVETCAGLPASCSAIWIIVSKMGGWPDQLLKTDGLAVWRRTRDASGGKSVTFAAREESVPLRVPMEIELPASGVYKAPIRLPQQIDLPPGQLFLRVGVLDRTSNKVATLELPLKVSGRGR